MDELIRSPDGYSAKAFLEKEGLLILVMDDFGGMKKKDAEGYLLLDHILKNGKKYGIRAIIAETASKLGNGTIEEYARATGCGVALGGASGTRYLDDFNNAVLPYGQIRTNLSTGRGYFVRNGNAQIMQSFAFWDKDSLSPEDCQMELSKSLDKIREKFSDFKCLE